MAHLPLLAAGAALNLVCLGLTLLWLWRGPPVLAALQGALLLVSLTVFGLGAGAFLAARRSSRGPSERDRLASRVHVLELDVDEYAAENRRLRGLLAPERHER